MATVVDCPTCGKKVEWTETNKYRPFCSERCKQIDLGAWAASLPSIHRKIRKTADSRTDSRALASNPPDDRLPVRARYSVLAQLVRNHRM